MIIGIVQTVIIAHYDFRTLNSIKLELCSYSWIRELREPTKGRIDPLIPQGAKTLKTFIFPYPSYPVLKLGHVLPLVTEIWPKM